MQSLFAALNEAMERKVAFLGTFFVIFTITYAAFAAFDFLPEPVKAGEKAPIATTTVKNTVPTPAVQTSPSSTTTQTTTTTASHSTQTTPTTVKQSSTGELPKTLTIDALGRTLTVYNPASRSVSSLDTALLSGVVRHPDSAELDQNGNVFILGHSSYLPVVHNKSYQAFNGIQNLKWGDTIRVDSATTEYVYRVEKVYKAKASGLVIPVAEAGKHLTLATCNSFGTTDDRFIVEASLLSTKPL
jgi:LPXTG-site transpeptidase (sortase) family protein